MKDMIGNYKVIKGFVEIDGKAHKAVFPIGHDRVTGIVVESHQKGTYHSHGVLPKYQLTIITLYKGDDEWVTEHDGHEEYVNLPDISDALAERDKTPESSGYLEEEIVVLDDGVIPGIPFN